jgi:hypothetical protein
VVLSFLPPQREVNRSAKSTMGETSMFNSLRCYARRVALLPVVLLIPIASQALLIGQHVLDLGYDVPTLDGASSTLAVTVCFTNDPCEPTIGFFADHILSSADAGSTLTATGATDAMFDPKTQALINGVDDDVAIVLRLSGESSFWLLVGAESQIFFAQTPNGIDFAGFALDSIDLALSNDFTVTPDPSTGTTALRGTITLQVFGSVVPEPSTASLVGVGLACLVAARRRRSVHSRHWRYSAG